MTQNKLASKANAFTVADKFNKVAISIGIQDLSQLRQEYGSDAADALFKLPGKIISGQVSGDSARFLSKRGPHPAG
jgi:hypothetical protein